MSTSILAHAAPIVNIRDLRILSTEDLLLEQEYLQWARLGMIEDGVDATSIQWATDNLVAMGEVIGYRHHLANQHRHDPHCPTWPDTSSPRYQQLKQTARDLKTVWPIERFVRDVLAVELQPAGKNLKGRCPLPDHDDKTPSFHVYPADDHWHCHGCNRGTDIFDLAGLCFRVDSFRERVQRVKDATAAMMGGAA